MLSQRYSVCALALLMLSAFLVTPAAAFGPESGEPSAPSSASGPAPEAAFSDLIVDGLTGNHTFQIGPCRGAPWAQRGNISVVNGGLLIIEDCTVEFLQDQSHRFWFSVSGSGGGRASTLQMTRASITSNGSLIDPYLILPLTVASGAKASLDWSWLVFPGIVQVTDATMWMNYSGAKGIKGSMDPNGPTWLLTNARLETMGSWIKDLPEVFGAVGPLRATPDAPGAGSVAIDNTRAQDTVYAGVFDGQNLSVDTWNTGQMTGPFTRVSLGVRYHVEDPANYSGTPNFVQWALQGTGFQSTSIRPLPADTADATYTFDLLAQGVNTVEEIRDLNVQFQHRAGGGSVHFDYVFVEVVEKPATEFSLWGASTFLAIDTFIDLDYRDESSTGNRNYMNISGTSTFWGFGAYLDDDEGGATPLGPSLVTTASTATGFLFRWVNVTVLDNARTAVSDATVALDPNYTQNKGSVIAWNDVCNPAHAVGKQVVAWVKRTYRSTADCATNTYSRTGADGRVVLAAFSDRIEMRQFPNAWYGGKYNIVGTHTNGKCTGYVGTWGYPETKWDQNFHDIEASCPFSVAQADLFPDVSDLNVDRPYGRPTNLTVVANNRGAAGTIGFTARIWDDLVHNGRYDPGADDLICESPVPAVPAGGNQSIQCGWTPMKLEGDLHDLFACLDIGNVVLNEPPGKKSDNCDGGVLRVLTRPDVQSEAPETLDSSGTPQTSFVSGAPFSVRANICNTGQSDTGSGFDVQFYFNDSRGQKLGAPVRVNMLKGSPDCDVVTLPGLTFPNAVTGYKICFALDINKNVAETPTGEGNNEGCNKGVSTLPAPDLYIGALTVSPTVPEDWSTAQITVTWGNKGSWSLSGIRVVVRLDGADPPLADWPNLKMDGGKSTDQKKMWNVPNGTAAAGPHKLKAEFVMDAVGPVKDTSPSNNFNETNLTVKPVQVRINLANAPQWGTGRVFQDTDVKAFPIPIQGTINRVSEIGGLDGKAVPEELVTLYLNGSSGAASGQRVTKTFTTKGTGAFLFLVNQSDVKPGDYTFTITTGPHFALASGKLKIEHPEPPYLLYAAIGGIIAAIVGGILGLLLYSRSKLRKMVECGECGAVVNETDAKCPKCGVTFEVEQVKCSSCMTWIPFTATECPKCGVVFAAKKGKGAPAAAGDDALKAQYEDWKDGFRQRYKKRVGGKFDENRFMQWFKTQPEFMTFDVFKQQRGGGAAGGQTQCPTCGTMNPPGAALCQRCGTDLESAVRRGGRGGMPPPPPPPEEGAEVAGGAAISPKAPGSAGEKRRVVKPPSGGGPAAAADLKKRCPTCGTMNPMDRTNCIDCGEALPPSLPCSGCGSPVAADAKFCAVCGKPQK